MAEPKKRLTSARSGARRSHLHKKPRVLSQCPKCLSPTFSHFVCQNCGFYRGTDVLKLAEKAALKNARRKSSEAENSENKQEGKK